MQRIVSRLCGIAAIVACASCTLLPSSASSGHHRNHPISWQKADPPSITLYDKTSAGGDNLCTIPINEAGRLTVNLKEDDFGCDSDEADSMILHNMPAGSTISAHDSPNCSKGDDWHLTTVVQSRPGVDIMVPSFQTDWHNPVPYDPTIDAFKWATILELHYDNGLNGLVSCLDIWVPPRSP